MRRLEPVSHKGRGKMRQSARIQRQQQIEEAALSVLSVQGYAGMTMQAVAKAAGASMETLYKWYGDKNGLLRALALKCAGELHGNLGAAIPAGADGWQALSEFSPMLLEQLTSDRLIALNRAAATDNVLGQVLYEASRGAFLPVLGGIIKRLHDGGEVQVSDTAEAAEVYLDLLVGGLQVQRVSYHIPALAKKDIRLRADRAVHLAKRLWSGQVATV